MMVLCPHLWMVFGQPHQVSSPLEVAISAIQCMLTYAIPTSHTKGAKIKMLGKNRKFEKISDELHHLAEFYRNPDHKFPKSMDFMAKFETFDKFEEYG